MESADLNGLELRRDDCTYAWPPLVAERHRLCVEHHLLTRVAIPQISDALLIRRAGLEINTMNHQKWQFKLWGHQQ